LEYESGCLREKRRGGKRKSIIINKLPCAANFAGVPAIQDLVGGA
jgi:hypothetical protein